MRRYRYLLGLWLRLLLVFLLGRAGFMLYNRGLEPFSAGDMARAWLHGLSMDMSAAGYVTALPWLLCLAALWWPALPLRRVLRPCLALLGALLGVITCVDAALYEFWKFKLCAAVFAYMGSPEGVTSSVSGWFLVTRGLAIALCAALFAAVLARGVPRRLPAPRRRTPHACLMLLLGGVLFLTIRGGAQESTMNPGSAYYSPRLFLNHAAVNPAFSLLYSAAHDKRFARQFRCLPPDECARVFRGLYPERTEGLTDTLLRVRRPDVLIVLMEGFGGKFVPQIGGLRGVAPRFTRLVGEGVFWDNYYSNSFRTDRGIVSLLSGWVSYPTASLMRYPEKLSRAPGLGRSLAAAGYDTDYLYGGDIRIMGQRGYLVQAGYRRLTSQDDFTLAQANESKWGVNDGLTCARLLDMVRARRGGRPWHTVYQTLSSHEPFRVPYRRLADDKLNAFAYTDECVGALVDSLKALPSWDNLLLILVPDHGFLYDLTYEDPAFFHCPMLWLGGALRGPRRVSRLMSQSDVAATLLAQMGLPHSDYPWSRNVLSPGYTRPFVYCTFASGLMLRDTTGVTMLDTGAGRVIMERPAPSPGRERRAKAILQTSYDLLDAM